MDDKTVEDLKNSESKFLVERQLQYGWNWFSYHAGQRLSAFNFFLIIVGILFTGYFKCLEQGLHFQANLVAFFGVLISIAFMCLDIRNLELVNCGRNALDTTEPWIGMAIRNNDADRIFLKKSLFGRFSKGEVDSEFHKKHRLIDLLTKHSTWFRIIHISTAIVFLFAIAYSGAEPLTSADDALIGEVVAYWGNITDLPANWHLCDGSIVRDTRSPLYGTMLPVLTDERFLMGVNGAELKQLISKRGGSNIGSPSGEHVHEFDVRRSYIKIPSTAGDCQKTISYVNKIQAGSKGDHSHGDQRPQFQGVYFVIRIW